MNTWVTTDSGITDEHLARICVTGYVSSSDGHRLAHEVRRLRAEITAARAELAHVLAAVG